jgi:hypothetical protein
MSYEEIREQVAEANRVLAAVGLAAGAIAWHGHVSMRVPEAPDRFVMKNRGSLGDVLAKARADDMVVCDLEGFTVERSGEMTPAREVKMHSCLQDAPGGAGDRAHPRAILRRDERAAAARRADVPGGGAIGAAAAACLPARGARDHGC